MDLLTLLAVGAFAHLAKPFDVEDLVAAASAQTRRQPGARGRSARCHRGMFDEKLRREIQALGCSPGEAQRLLKVIARGRRR